MSHVDESGLQHRSVPFGEPRPARASNARTRQNKNPDRAGIFCPRFRFMHWAGGQSAVA